MCSELRQTKMKPDKGPVVEHRPFSRGFVWGSRRVLGEGGGQGVR